MRATTDPYTYPTGTQATIVVHPPAETKRPVGFAPWPKEENAKPTKAPRKRKAA